MDVESIDPSLVAGIFISLSQNFALSRVTTFSNNLSLSIALPALSSDRDKDLTLCLLSNTFLALSLRIDSAFILPILVMGSILYTIFNSSPCERGYMIVTRHASSFLSIITFRTLRWSLTA